ncbi:hypothetical protein BGZ83_008981 [Gryganskiella cystojenkinii]|nr:hypothetical protein BGZ83_008981 [Gryganskiella cystojenkinii]
MAPVTRAYLPSFVWDLVHFDRDTLRSSSFQPNSIFLDTKGLLIKDTLLPGTILPDVVLHSQITTPPEPRDLDPFKLACLEILSELRSLLETPTRRSLSDLYSEQLTWMNESSRRACEIWFDLFTAGTFDQAWLIGSTVLEQLLGTIQVLKTMLGSPMTLNIRNLLWHGFITPQDEIPLDAYGAMLLGVTMTIAASAQGKFKGATPLARHLSPEVYYHCGSGDREDLQPQPQEIDATTTSHSFDRIYESAVFKTGPIPQVDVSKSAKALYELIDVSMFVTPGTKSQWRSAIGHLDDNTHKRQFVFVMSTLPLIEHALRLLYVTNNACKEDRRAALIAGEYYVTLDVILDRTVPSDFFYPDSPVLHKWDPDCIPNQLYSAICPSVMNQLNDLFMLDLGPRLRDRTSHGEFNVFLGRDITMDPWFNCYVGLVIHLLYRHIPAHELATEHLCLASDDYELWISLYTTTRFDEWAALKKEAARCLVHLTKYRAIAVSLLDAGQESSHDFPRIPWVTKPTDRSSSWSCGELSVFNNLETFSTLSIQELVVVCDQAWPSSCPQSSRFSCNIPAWIMILQSIQFATEKVTSKIMTYSEQLKQRTLSSRGRKQLDQIRPLVPGFLGMLTDCLVLIEQLVMSTSSALSTDSSSERQQEPQQPTRSTTGVPATTTRPVLESSHTPEGKTIIQVIDRSSTSEIQLRLRITTFVDQFVSQFEKVKLELIPLAWEQMDKHVGLLLEREKRSYEKKL